MASREPHFTQKGTKPAARGRLNDGFKQRIVGALVLAALAVIFLPTLFDREGARYIDVTSQIPPPPDIQPIEISEPTPVEGGEPVPEPEEIFQPQPLERPLEDVGERDSGTGPEKTESSADAASGAEKAEPPQKAQQDSAPVLDADGLPVAWVVQVASYSESSRADKLRARLLDEGYKAYIRAATTDKGRLSRVFVGPKVSEEDARAVKQELDQLLAVQTLVMRFRP